MAKTQKITKEELLQMAKSMTIQEIADSFELSYTTIWKYLKKLGYRRKVGRPKSFNLS